MSAREVIAAEIALHGPLPFSRYMELCLYHPTAGYYSRPQEKFGKAGDFYTSSDVHAVYGRLLARQFDELWRNMDRPPLQLVELGPGRGLFMRDVLDWSRKKFPEFYEAVRVVLVESSPSLRDRLQQRLEEHAPKVQVQEVLPPAVPHAIVFANEFFDALPVEVLDARGQVFVDVEEGSFVERFHPPSPEVLEFADRYSVHPEQGRIEVCPAALGWMERIARSFESGYVIAVDYGFTRGEQLAGRHLDTLMTFREHKAGEDPYEAPGEQDITTHVNFTALQAAGEKAGLAHLGFVTQSQFLLGIGEATQFADAFEEARLPQEQAKIALQLKHLITPAGMGEKFHAMVMGRDAAGKVAGLSFGR